MPVAVEQKVPSIAPYSKHWNLIQTMFVMSITITKWKINSACQLRVSVLIIIQNRYKVLTAELANDILSHLMFLKNVKKTCYKP
jgi:hypothetical protein